MFNLPSVRVGRFFGIPIELNVSWFIVFVLVAVLLSFNYFPSLFPGRPLVVDITSGVITALLFFVSVVLHELTHSLVARAGGIRIAKITLFVFGGVAQMDEEPRTPGREAVMAAAGPAMSLLLAGVFWFATVGLKATGASNVLWAPVEYLAMINLAVAIFNLMPGFPLDGGRVLRAAVWGVTGDLLRATRYASMAGQGIGYVLVALSVWGILVLQQFGFVWLGLIGWFIAGIARNSYQQQVMASRLADFTVGSVMSSPPVVVPGDLTLEQLAHDYFLGQRHSRYPVREGDRIVGLITLAEAKSIPRDRWGSTRVLDVADRDMSRLAVSPQQPLQDVLPLLGPEEPGALLAMADGRIEGIVTRSDVIQRLRVSDAIRP